MPYKTWSVGEEMLAADFSTYIGNQVVATFVDAAQRTAQLPGPDVGQLSTLDSRPGALSIFNGSAWVDVAPFVQSGNDVLSTNAAGGATITFPTPFAAAPNSIALVDLDASSTVIRYFGVVGSQLLAATCGIVVRTHTGAVHASGLVRVGWTAIGLRS